MIYFDHNATTQASSSVRIVMLDTQIQEWGNPNSPHDMGISSAVQVQRAAQIIKHHINGANGRIIWTGSGSSANHIAITGMCQGPGHLVTSYLEHKSIECIRRRYGNAVPTSGFEWERQINEYTKLISLIYVNNETGLINNLFLIKPLLENHPACFHIDAVQALGKVKIDVEELGCDLMTLSAHKIYGPKGVGCLWVRDGVKVNIPYLGTANVPGIVGFGEAVKNLDIYQYLSELMEKEEYFLSQLQNTGVQFKMNTDTDSKIPGTLSLSFPGVSNVELVLELSTKEVYVSIGSACSGGRARSRILEEMQLPEDQIASTIRVSLGKHCSLEEISTGAQIISETVKELRDGPESRKDVGGM